MEQDGFANRYSFQTDGLSILNLSDGKYNILNWLSILLMNRKFNLSSDIAVQGKEYLASTFLPPYENYDVIIGYGAVSAVERLVFQHCCCLDRSKPFPARFSVPDAGSGKRSAAPCFWGNLPLGRE